MDNNTKPKTMADPLQEWFISSLMGVIGIQLAKQALDLPFNAGDIEEWVRTNIKSLSSPSLEVEEWEYTNCVGKSLESPFVISKIEEGWELFSVAQPKYSDNLLFYFKRKKRS